jgi:hypothetical protein
MSREAVRSIRQREAPAKQSGKKQIFKELTSQFIPLIGCKGRGRTMLGSSISTVTAFFKDHK